MIHDLLVWFVIASAIVVLVAYVVINGVYLFVHFMGALELHQQQEEREYDPAYRSFSSQFLPGIAVIVPAYNEQETIVDNVRSLIDIDYPDRTVIMVNDGSTDETLARVRAAYQLELIDDGPPWDLGSEAVRGIYRSTLIDDFFVIDKAPGGKSDALNAAINFTDQPLFCTIDADSIIDRDGLRRAIAPFVANPKETISAGGTVRVANGCTIEGGQVVETGMADKLIVQLQEMEYLRAFYSGRLGLHRLRSLLVISGTFGVFRTDLVREIGGYRVDTVTEDLDLVVRLHRYMRQADEDYRVEFVSDPVVWTQAPETLADLSRQRRRWYRGMLEVLSANRDMIGNPRFGYVGVFALPFHVLAEAIGPLIETYGYVMVPLAFLLGILNLEFFIVFLLVIVGIGIVLSTYGVFSEVWSYRRYDQPRQISYLLFLAVLENLGYRQWRAFVSLRALIEYLRRDTGWGEIRRHRFEDED